VNTRVAIVYVVAAYTISWGIWWPLVAAGGAAPDSALRYLHLVGGLGPAVAGVLAVRHLDGPRGLRRVADRVWRWRVGLRWHMLAWGSPFVLLGAAVLFIRVVTADAQPVRFDRSEEFPRLPMALYWAASLVAYGFGEELGWRGVLLPRLQARFGTLASTAIVSVVWAGWHLPLFWFAPGMSRMGGAEVAGWYASLFTGSVLFTWLFNATGGSVLITAVFHGAMDVAFLATGPRLLPAVLGAFVTVWGLALLVGDWLGRGYRYPRVIDG
jgi:CAAX protease family protein